MGWNSWTLQWLSQAGVNAPDQIFAKFSQDEDVKSRIVRQQDKDWRQFLAMRAIELRQGGRCLSLFPAQDPKGRSWQWLSREFWQAIKELESEQLLSADDSLRLTFPTNARALEEIWAPFDRDGVFERLRLEHVELYQGADPYWAPFVATADAHQLGTSWSNMMRAVFAPTCMQVLADHRNAVMVVDTLFARFAERIASNPQMHEHFLAVVVLSKIA